jgi:hypothetical protein
VIIIIIIISARPGSGTIATKMVVMVVVGVDGLGISGVPDVQRLVVFAAREGWPGSHGWGRGSSASDRGCQLSSAGVRNGRNDGARAGAGVAVVPAVGCGGTIGCQLGTGARVRVAVVVTGTSDGLVLVVVVVVAVSMGMLSTSTTSRASVGDRGVNWCRDGDGLLLTGPSGGSGDSSGWGNNRSIGTTFHEVNPASTGGEGRDGGSSEDGDESESGLGRHVDDDLN